ncbi:hypothetical protein SSX86_024223 [Deinandra increscens subsp. villosa]|uniref:Uncharacterized protein n=1 Tax=Deinandra increscens subsp. villosa TaxID=3103831 RepID=A0AAP0CP64_9ASTR
MEAIRRFGVRYFGGFQKSEDPKMVGGSKVEDDEMMKKLALTRSSCPDATVEGKISIGDDFVMDVPEGKRCVEKKDVVKATEPKSSEFVDVDGNVIACKGKSANVLDRTTGAENNRDGNSEKKLEVSTQIDSVIMHKDAVGCQKDTSEAVTTKRASKKNNDDFRKRTKLVNRDALKDGVRCSPRIAQKRAFSSFKNDADTPRYVDDSGTAKEVHDIMKEKGKRAKVDAAVKVCEKEAKKQKGKGKVQLVKDRGINNSKSISLICPISKMKNSIIVWLRKLVIDGEYID